MGKIYTSAIAIGFFLCSSHIWVQSIPINYHERMKDSNEDTPPIQNDPPSEVDNNRQDSSDPLARAAPGDTDGLVMFPILSEENKMLHTGKKAFNLFPKMAKTNEPADQRSSQSGNQRSSQPGNQRSSQPGSQRTGDPSSAITNADTEMTISVPEYKTDRFGNFLFRRGSKAPDIEERAKVYGRSKPNIKRFGPGIQQTFYPSNYMELETVCLGSTPYNRPRVMPYLKPRIYDRLYPIRAVWMDLREQIWKDGDSQECHTPNMTEFYKYINCAIRRNMRMEYLVPKYPLHQQGYYFFIKNRFFDIDFSPRRN